MKTVKFKHNQNGEIENISVNISLIELFVLAKALKQCSETANFEKDREISKNLLERVKADIKDK